MASITASGIGSGLDISGLVAQLVSAESTPATTRLDRQEKQASAELSALGSLKSALSSLQASLKSLSGSAGMQAMKAVSSDETLFTAVASDKASAGQYQVEVLRLAQRHKLASDTFDNTQTFGGATGDQLQIAAGDASFTLDLSTARTLAEIRDGINAAADNPGVTATLVRVDDTREVLMINAAGTGRAQAVTVTEALAGGLSLSLDMTNRDAFGQPLTDVAQLDAAVQIDGIEVTRPGNQLTDLIDGLTLDLKRAAPDKTAMLEVGADRTAAATAITAFVDQYNAMVDTLNKVSGFKGVGAEQPALFGDAATRALGTRLRSEVGSDVAGAGGSFSALAEIGIRTGKDGKLTLDSKALDAALAKDRAGVGALFGAEDGLAERLDGLIGSYLESGGILDARTKGVQGRLERIEDSREALERRMSALEARYQKQFAAMDALVGQLQTTGSFLTQQLSSLNSTKG